MQPKQLHNCPQDKETNKDSDGNDGEQSREDNNNEEPIRCTGALRRGGVGEK